MEKLEKTGCYSYIVQSVDTFKIGATQHLYTLMTVLKMSNPTPVRIVAVFSHNTDSEAIDHAEALSKRFNKNHLRNGWFYLTVSQVNLLVLEFADLLYIKDKAIRYHYATVDPIVSAKMNATDPAPPAVLAKLSADDSKRLYKELADKRKSENKLAKDMAKTPKQKKAMINNMKQIAKSKGKELTQAQKDYISNLTK